jgi:hypothetical protein
MVPVALRKDSSQTAFSAAHAESARSETPTYWICLALLLALIALAARIATTL